MEFEANVFPLGVRIKPIGLIHSCFTEKFGIPRQPGLVPSAVARLELLPPCNREEMVRGLEQFSHIWVHFLFHQTVAEGWKPTVRPPWLGGRKRVGVFASRSPHRPNHLGLSVVKLGAIIKEKAAVSLELYGVDFLDGTPVFDIKPYIPYSDNLQSASCGYAHGEQTEVRITFDSEARDFCLCYQRETGRNIEQLIREMIRHDPRPASQKKDKSWFGMLLWDVNIRWCIEEEGVKVAKCIKVPAKGDIPEC